jgi:hypothetical protein
MNTSKACGKEKLYLQAILFPYERSELERNPATNGSATEFLSLCNTVKGIA